MITSTKNYTKQNKTKQKWSYRTLGQMIKAKLYRQNLKEAYTYTLTKRGKGKKYIYICIKKGREQPNQ